MSCTRSPAQRQPLASRYRCFTFIAQRLRGLDGGALADVGEKTKARRAFARRAFHEYCRQRPTLPHSFPCSTIGGIRLNFRVRNGNGCDPDPMTTGILGVRGLRLRAYGATARVVPDNLLKSLFRRSARGATAEQLNILQT